MNVFSSSERIGSLLLHACSMFALIGALSSTLPSSISAQDATSTPGATRTVAITNATIVVSPGRTLNNGTVVMRDGLIAAVGTNVSIPFDAQEIAGDSLTVYAGFIDGLSHTGIPEPKSEQRTSGQGDERVNRANPTDEAAGIQPDRSAHELIESDHETIDALRKVGFTAAHVVPHGNMLPGAGALILLAGDDTRDMVIKRDVSMFAQLKGSGRLYPATPMGVMAKMRQLYREADRRKQMEALYASNVPGAPRPEFDPTHYAFFPVIDGDQPVFMNANSALEIYRALRLHNELGYPLMLGGLYEGFESIDLLLDADVPLFATLKLPKLHDSAKSETDSTATEEPAPYNPALHVTDHTNTEVERVNLQERQRIFYKEYLSTTASLHNAGLNFGFTTMDVKPDQVHENLKKMIENGLSEDVALAALTTNAARNLGVAARMGTVESGKMANLVVTSGPLFQDDTYIKYVFVDGHKFEYEKGDAPRGPQRNTSRN